jgi:hypothetical protein
MTTTTKRSRKPAVKPAPAPNGSHPLALDIQVNLDAMTWEDMKILMTAQGRELSDTMILDIYGLFERVVIGGAKAVPVMRTLDAITAIGAAMKGLGNPKA